MDKRYGTVNLGLSHRLVLFSEQSDSLEIIEYQDLPVLIPVKNILVPVKLIPVKNILKANLFVELANTIMEVQNRITDC